ncbi:MAG: HNH endonuclease [Metamycoplasmataceae bacterium]
MIKIHVSDSLIKSLISLRRRDWNEELEKEYIFKKIKEALILDGLIYESEEIIFLNTRKSFQGCYIENKNIIVCFSQMFNFKGGLRSRNTYIMQNFNPAFEYSIDIKANIHISINPFDINRRLTKFPESIENDLETLFNLNVIINKSISNKKYKRWTLDEYIQKKWEIKNKNKGNNSTYIKFLEDKTICVFGKLDGANISGTINTCRIISNLNKDNLNLIFMQINNHNDKNKKLLEKIKNIGFNIVDEENEENELRAELEKMDKIESFNIESLLKRNQKLFLKNIIEKYMDIDGFDLNRCFACNYKIQMNLISAHIYRYSDIIRDFHNKKLTSAEAAHLIVSGENGFLLCPNQDKEFEKGMIYFDLENKKFEARKINIDSHFINEIKNRITNQKFEKIKYTNEFEKNIYEHIKRIT